MITTNIGDKSRKAIQKKIFVILNFILFFSLVGCEQPDRSEVKVT